MGNNNCFPTVQHVFFYLSLLESQISFFNMCMISVIHMIIRCFLDQNRCDNLDFCFDLTLSRIKISTCITMYTIQSQKLMIK